MMTSTASSEMTPASRASPFALTRWTLVCTAADSASAQSEQALAEICRLYWPPLYAYLRRRGHDAHEAQDLTQEFFARFLAKHYLRSVTRDKGKFRSFLLACLKHFLANEWDRVRAQKRGGGRPILPIETLDAETRYRQEPADTLTPDKLFDRQWAITLLDHVLALLRNDCAADGKQRLFDELKIFLTAGKGELTYAKAAQRLDVTEGAAKVAVHRLRKRYREILREEIAQTVARPDQVDEELHALFAAFGP